MKTFFLLIFLIAVPFVIKAQTIFNKTYPKPEYDYATAVVETNENTYLIASSSASQYGTDYDICLMNIDTLGNILWEKYTGYPNHKEFANTISKTADGGFIIGGSYRFSGSYDTYILKTDPQGNGEWSFRVNPSPVFEDGFSAFENDAGDYIIIGRDYDHTNLYNITATGSLNWSVNFTDFTSNQVLSAPDGGYILAGYTVDYTGSNFYQIVLKKTDDTGNTLWTKEYGGELEDYTYAMALCGSEGYMIAGATSSEGFDMNYLSYLIKTDLNGDTLWTKKHNTGFPHSIQSTADGGYIYSATKYFDLPFGGLYQVNAVKTDADGNILWHNSFDNRSFYTPGNNIQEVSDGGYLLTCHTTDTQKADVNLIKMDASGNVTTQIFPNSSRSDPFTIFPNPATDKITVRLMNDAEKSDTKIELFGCTGKRIAKKEKSNSRELIFNVRLLDPGIYYLRISLINNPTKAWTEKIIITK